MASVVKTGKFIGIVVIGVLFAAVSVYYYFRVLQAMYFKDGNVVLAPVTSTYKFLLLVVAALVVLIGIFPDALLSLMYF